MALRERLAERFEPLADDVLGVMLWGSVAAGEGGLTPRSDVDVCLVAGPDTEPEDALREAWRRVNLEDLGEANRRVDLSVFENLPRHLQGAVIEADDVLVTRDEPALFEYLYPCRKLWNDERRRHELTREEALEILRGSDARV